MWFQRSKRKSQTPSEGPPAEPHPSSSAVSGAGGDGPLPPSASTLASSSSSAAPPRSPGTGKKASGKGASPSPKTPTKRRGSSGQVPNSPSNVAPKASATSSASSLATTTSSSSSSSASPAPASSPSERGENVYIRSVDDLAMLDRPITLKDVENLKEEFDRKIRVLSQCLEEKAEENVTMHEQLESQNKRVNDLKQRLQQSSDIENLVSEMNALLRIKEDETQQLQKNIVQKDQDCKRLTELNDEYSRRIQVLSECLSEMAEENMAFSRPLPSSSSSSSTIRSHILPSASSSSATILSSLDKGPQNSSSSTPSSSSSSGPEKESPKPEDLNGPQAAPSMGTAGGNAIQQTATAAMAAAAAASDAARKQLEERLSVLQEEHDALRTQMQTQEKRIVQLNTKLMESVNKQTASEESNKMYEKKLKSLEKEMLDNLRQEGARRQEAEYQASKLKKRLAELQFLLDERDQDDDDDDDDDDDGDETDDD